MLTLRVVAGGDSDKERAQKRGKLFEDLVAVILRHLGYSVAKQVKSVNYAGMEIDVEGASLATAIPLYAECKCYGSLIDSTAVQAFLGKYVTRWSRDKRCHGLFVALPGVNSHALGFYKDNLENNHEFTVKLYVEDDVLHFLQESQLVRVPLVSDSLGSAGDTQVLWTDKGLFLAQLLIPEGSGLPSDLALYSGIGEQITDPRTSEYLIGLLPDLRDFHLVADGRRPVPIAPPESHEQIVEVHGGATCFEYQFPASPAHFVGRAKLLEETEQFASQVLKRDTALRGLLFEAHSGWGKSSLALAATSRLNSMGHLAFAIDSRSASSAQFILRAIDHVLGKIADAGWLVSLPAADRRVLGFSGLVDVLKSFSDALEAEGRLLIVFFDQFENLFFMPEALHHVKNLFLRVADLGGNICFGFCWKTDLVVDAHGFPYQERDAISGLCRKIVLSTFSVDETSAMLDKLSQELHAPLRKDLAFLLSEFSQGYPWLLKRLCSHVKAQREAGLVQSEIASRLLNVEELFQEDLRGLSVAEEDALRRLAKVVPVAVSDLGDEVPPEVMQSLVHRRLVVRVGNKYDLYWDIFRDFLNYGRLPVQENYILRSPIGGVLRACELLADAGGSLQRAKFRRVAKLTDKSLGNVGRDMRLLGIAVLDANQVSLRVGQEGDRGRVEATLRSYVREKLPRNRLIARVVEALPKEGQLSLRSAAAVLRDASPYIAASERTWMTYARVIAEWLDFADLAAFDRRANSVRRLQPGTEVRQREPVRRRRRGSIVAPAIQYEPIEKMLLMLCEAVRRKARPAWELFTRSTYKKCLLSLEDLGFIAREKGTIRILASAFEFADHPEKRATIFGTAALRIPAFKAFVDLLAERRHGGATLHELAWELRKRIRAYWGEGTAGTIAKIMLDWARHLGLAPGAFSKRPRKRKPRGRS